MKQTPITKSAIGEDCALRIPGICNFDNETTVFCHAPCVDKGVGIKGPDWWGAYGCSACHALLDNNTGYEKMPQDAAWQPIKVWWLGAIYETQKKLFAKGLLHD